MWNPDDATVSHDDSEFTPPAGPPGSHGARALTPGAMLGDLVLEALLGEGGAGSVWRARNSFTGQVLAIKVCHDPALRATLANEARALGQLMAAARRQNFPATIVRLLETHLGHEPPYLVMEFMAGGDLRSRLKRAGTLDEREAFDLLVQVLDAMEFVHELGLTHRDIKPENILLDEEGRAKVTDFGLGRVTAESVLSIHRSMASSMKTGRDITGTLDYMAPEQLDGRPATPATDLYSLGIVLFEMLAGERPRGLTKPSRRRPGLRTAWDGLFERCYAHDPMDRFQSAEEFRDALRAAFPEWVTERLVEPAGDAPAAPRARRRRPSPLGSEVGSHHAATAAEVLSIDGARRRLQPRRTRGHWIFGLFIPAIVWSYLVLLATIPPSWPTNVSALLDGPRGHARTFPSGYALALEEIAEAPMKRSLYIALVWIYCGLLFRKFTRWSETPRGAKTLLALAMIALTFASWIGFIGLIQALDPLWPVVALALHALFLGDVRAKLMGRRGLFHRRSEELAA